MSHPNDISTKKENKLDHYHSPTIAIDLAHIQRIFHGNAQENDNWKIILGLNEKILILSTCLNGSISNYIVYFQNLSYSIFV